MPGCSVVAKERDFRFYDLRHCAASYLPLNEAILAEVGQMLGRKSAHRTERYATRPRSTQGVS